MDFIPSEKVGIKDDRFRHIKAILRTWGQRKELLFLCYFILFIKVVGFSARTLFIMKTFKDPEVLLEISATYPIPLLAVAKTTFLLIRYRKVRFLFDTVKTKFWDVTLAGSEISNYWHKRFLFINFLILGHLITSSLYVVQHLLFASVPIPEGRTRWMPVLVTLPFNSDRSPFYEIVLVLLSWNMFFSVFGNGFFDVLFVYATQHLCCQFSILKVVLRDLEFGLMTREDDVERFWSKKFQKELYSRLAVCIKHHNLLMRYGNELKSLTSLIFGIQCLTTLLTLVLVGYTLTENLEELTKSTMLISFVFSSVMQFSIFAVQSADIHDQSASIADAAYQSNWYLFNAKAKRGLTLLIMNSQKGITMYGAGLVAINNEVIVKMGQKVFSFITLLRSIAA